MPQKIYTVKNLDCANCAAKIERKLEAHPKVESASIVFATRQLRLTAEDPDALLPELERLAETVEAGVRFTSDAPSAHAPQDHCGCGHDHEHEHEHNCACGHDHAHDHSHSDHDEEESPLPLLLGALLFAAGLFTSMYPLPSSLLFLCAYLLLGLPVLKAALRGILKGHVLDENFLMSITTIGAFVINEFPEAVGVMLFYRVGEFFEHRAVSRSRKQIMAAIDLRPETVTRLRDGQTEVIPAADAQPGDLLLVRPGDRIPLDGQVVTGESRLDTAPITGESVPVAVHPGSQVISGCVNLSGQLTVTVTAPLSQSMVTRILNSVESAAATKPKIQRFITRFAAVYTPIVVIAAVLVAVVPSLITGNWSYWVYTALSFLVMSCPCALVLSVPLAFFCGIGTGSKQGILFKGGDAMEALSAVKVVAMDKTGTLTKGEFKVQQATSEQVLSLCAACEQHSTHPIAVSILEAAKERMLCLSTPEAVEELAGKGIRARLNGRTVLCGNRALLEGVSIPEADTLSGATQVFVAVDGVYEGCITISDAAKPSSAAAVRQLTAMGLKTAMLTGDTKASAETVGAALAVHEVHAGLLPHQKLECLQALRSSHGGVLFVGDGINDAPVLSGADVGAAMGSGADAAMEAADLVFMTSDMAAVPQAIRIARRTRAIAWQNVVFALAVKAVVMALGLLGGASMWLAVFADSGVAMLCVLNSVRLLFKKP